MAAGFEKECLNLVKKLGNDKIKLVLELTERNPIPVTPEARAIFDSLHQHNITFALDDFGTGYATYRYLQAFPVDFIKIDKSFVQMASVDEISGHIVDNIVEPAETLMPIWKLSGSKCFTGIRISAVCFISWRVIMTIRPDDSARGIN